MCKDKKESELRSHLKERGGGDRIMEEGIWEKTIRKRELKLKMQREGGIEAKNAERRRN